MIEKRVSDLIEVLISDEITAEQHAELQDILMADSAARELLRARMDMECSLRTWATEATPGEVFVASGSEDSRFGLLALAATIILVMVPLALWYSFSNWSDSHATNPDTRVESPTLLLGAIRQQADCVWENRSAMFANGFTTGTLALTSGLAELQFHSGTNIVLEAPCELKVISAASAMLLAGSVFADVTELSDGFTLQTPELTISDEGTEFAVVLDESSTEVHVFDGSVLCKPTDDASGADEANERIAAGQARRFLRARPGRPNRIPFEARRFARQLKVEVQSAAGESLLAYDGFENPAGRMRPEKNGFGWSSGWKLVGREQDLPSIVVAPEGLVFGAKRPGRQLLRLENHDKIRRQFEQSISVDDDTSIFVSFLLNTPLNSENPNASKLLQVSLVPADASRGNLRRRGTKSTAFGVTDEGLPFVKCENQIVPSAPAIIDGTDYFVVFRVQRVGDGIKSSVRFFHASESLPQFEPTVWTIQDQPVQKDFEARALRMVVGEDAAWEIDELRIGTTWQSVLPHTLLPGQ